MTVITPAINKTQVNFPIKLTINKPIRVISNKKNEEQIDGFELEIFFL